MPNLLAIESSTDACSVAICCDGIIQETFVVQPREHNKILLPMIDELLRGLQLTFRDLDAIAFGAGPGSFTGLRLSAAIAQGLAFAAQKPVIPISSLSALAFSIGTQNHNPDPQTILLALDARMQDIYFGAYRYEHGELYSLDKDQLCPANQLAEKIKKYHDLPGVVKVGDGWPDTNTVTRSVYPRAQAVLALAIKRFAAGECLPAELALPVYLRETISWQKWQPKSATKTPTQHLP